MFVKHTGHISRSNVHRFTHKKLKIYNFFQRQLNV